MYKIDTDSIFHSLSFLDFRTNLPEAYSIFKSVKSISRHFYQHRNFDRLLNQMIDQMKDDIDDLSMFAISVGDVKLVEALYQREVIKDEYIAVYDDQPVEEEYSISPIDLAVTYNRPDMVKLLQSKGVSYTESTLDWAIESNSVEMVRFLIEEEEIECTTSNLEKMIVDGQDEMIHYLVDNGHLPEFDQEIIYLTIESGDVDLVKFLLSIKPEINLSYEEAMCYAQDEEMIDYLEEMI